MIVGLIVVFVPLINKMRDNIVAMGLPEQKLYNAVKRFNTIGVARRATPSGSRRTTCSARRPRMVIDRSAPLPPAARRPAGAAHQLRAGADPREAAGLGRRGHPRAGGLVKVLYGDEWRDHDFRGKRVAVLATGRDAACVVPGVAVTAASVKVFLEDADWVIPAMPGPLAGLVRVGAAIPVIGPRARRSAARIHLRLAVKDSWTRRLLTPDDRFGAHADLGQQWLLPDPAGGAVQADPLAGLRTDRARSPHGRGHRAPGRLPGRPCPGAVAPVPSGDPADLRHHPARGAHRMKKIAPAVHVDVLVMGAGVSGIGVACHLAREVPRASFLVLERRHAIGGTWDLFRYPGVRSDSDMYTFGYRFKPWHGTKVLADGESIKAYIEEAAEENGVTERIRFGRQVTKAELVLG